MTSAYATINTKISLDVTFSAYNNASAERYSCVTNTATAVYIEIMLDAALAAAGSAQAEMWPHVTIKCYANAVCELEIDFGHQMTALVESSDANSIGKHDANSTCQMTESVHSFDAELRTACLYKLGKVCTFSECMCHLLRSP